VVVPEDQLSLAIGRAGVNARLAARLTNWRVDIKSLPEAASEALRRVTGDGGFADLAERESAAIPQVEAILLKKAENRPVTPEEYQILNLFVDRVERELRAREGARRRERMEKIEAVRAAIPAGAHITPLADVGMSARVLNLLTAAGFENAGKVLETLALEPDAILGLSGVGPKTVEEIDATLRAFSYPEVVVEAPPPAEAEVEAEAGAEAPVEAAAPEVEAAAPAELLPVAEGAEAPIAVDLPVPAGEVEVGAKEAEAAVGAAPESVDFDAITKEYASILKVDVEEEEEAEPEAAGAAEKKKKKGKKGARVVVFDEERGVTVVQRRRKRDGEWTELDGLDEIKE